MFRLSHLAWRLSGIFVGAMPLLTLAAEPATELNPLVITATKTQKALRDVPAAVSVISREAIEQSPASTVDQLLQGVPGVYAARMDASSPNRIAQTYTRGLPGNSRTLVLLDGVPMNVLYDGQVDWSQLSTQDIERVEIVRGASSGLYGANAMGGVIHVLSRAPEAGSVTRLGAEYGSLNSKRLTASHSYGTGPTSLRLSASHFSSDGYTMWRPDTTVPVANQDAIGTVKQNASLKVAHELSAQSLLEAGVSYLKDEATGFYRPGAPGYQPSTREQWLPTLRYAREADGASTTAMVYARLGKQWADTLSTPSYRSIAEKGLYQDRTVGGNVQHAWTLTPGQQLTVGMDYLDGDLRNHFDYPGSTRLRDTRGDMRRYGLFVQDDMQLTPRWNLNLAARYDHWKTGGNQTDSGTGQPNSAYRSQTDSQLSPKLATLFKLNDAVNLRASAGQAFNLPDMFNLYADTKRGNVTYWANPALTPEKVNAYDFGVDVYFGQMGYVKATAYYNDAKDFIYSVQRNASHVDKINIGAVTTRGLELEAVYRVRPTLTLTGSYTLNQSKIVKNPRDVSLQGKSLTNVPRQQGFLKADYQWMPGSTLFATFNHVGKRYGNDANTTEYQAYSTVDIGLSHALGKQLTARLSVANVADKQYDGIGYIAPGRTVTVGVQAKF